eukprot:m.240078 g.240078  ORF g.240078 m.240078 type:complete len:200 (-) comp15819_c0_seq3:18-617(-)
MPVPHGPVESRVSELTLRVKLDIWDLSQQPRENVALPSCCGRHQSCGTASGPRVNRGAFELSLNDVKLATMRSIYKNVGSCMRVILPICRHVTWPRGSQSSRFSLRASVTAALRDTSTTEGDGEDGSVRESRKTFHDDNRSLLSNHRTQYMASILQERTKDLLLMRPGAADFHTNANCTPNLSSVLTGQLACQELEPIQ